MKIFFGLSRTLGAAIAVIAAVTAVSGAFIFKNLQDSHLSVDARIRSYEIIRGLDAFRIAMLDQETGVRGYAITGNLANLQPYERGRSELTAALATLRPLIAGDPAQVQRLAAAEAAARRWRTNVAEPTIGAMKNAADRIKLDQLKLSTIGKEQFDAFRQKLSAAQAEEEQHLDDQQSIVLRAQRNALDALIGSLVVILAICAAIALALNRMIARPLVKLAEIMRRLVRRDLSVDVPSIWRRDEVGEIARAVDVFKNSLIELDRTSVLRATADTLPAMVGYIDASRRIGFLNDEFHQWFALGAEEVAEVYGRPLKSVFSDGAFPGEGYQLEAAFGGSETRFEHRLRRLDGTIREFEVYFRPHRAHDGRILGVVTLLTDITERKAMERRLAQQASDLLRSNEELEQFAYVASHDLKAPLRGIENLVTWIEEDLEGQLVGDTRTNMDLAKTRVKRLESLLDDLLAYSRAGRGDSVCDLVDVGALVRELATLVSPPEGFSIKGAKDLPTIYAPPAALTQVLQNLMGNAVKHHDDPEHGEIWVDATRRGQLFEFSVTDNGPGVPERFRERVFGMFQTLRPRDEVEGSGMGLAIVKKLVERYGGGIWLEDAPSGRGLSVRFTWPSDIRETEHGADRQLALGG